MLFLAPKVSPNKPGTLRKERSSTKAAQKWIWESPRIPPNHLLRYCFAFSVLRGISQAKKKERKDRLLGLEIARCGGGLSREGKGVKKFVPCLESLFSLGFEGGNLARPVNIAGMSRTPAARGVQNFVQKKFALISLPLISGSWLMRHVTIQEEDGGKKRSCRKRSHLLDSMQLEGCD